MRLLRDAKLLLGGTGAFGWFILRGVPFVAVLPLIPLGYLYYRVAKNYDKKLVSANGLSALFAACAVSRLVSVGLFDGYGFWSVFFLLLCVSLMAVRVKKGEMERIFTVWSLIFLLVFLVMLFASIAGVEKFEKIMIQNNWTDTIIFYLLAFAEPFSMGREFSKTPCLLGVLLSIFGVISLLAMGNNAFILAEYPYLSVWAGVGISSFHHMEGIILSLYFGTGALRMAHFFTEFGKKHCNKIKAIV